MRLTDPLSQGREFLCCISMGFVQGAVYDLLNSKGRGLLRHTLDLLFCLCLLFGNFCLFLYSGEGSFPVFYVPGLLLGFFLWKKTLSKVFLAILGKIYRIFAFIFRPVRWILKKICEKSHFFSKKLFSKREKSVTIKERQIGKGGSLRV